MLEVGEDEVDSLRFERAVEDSRRKLAAGDPSAALAPLDEALSEWRGRPLAGLDYEPFAQDEIARLEELRLIALETRADAALQLGKHVRIVPELESLVHANPLRERFRAQLMLALYRSGRQADALAAYREARRVFAEELGLEPGEELRRLERAILDHDAALEPFAAAAAPRPDRGAVAPERAVLIATDGLDVLGLLLALAEPLAVTPPARELVITAVVDPGRLGAATTALAGRRDELIRRGVSTRSAAFSSPSPGEDIARLASEPGTDLVVLAAGTAPLEGHAARVLRDAPPDVALVLEAGGSLCAGPVVVPFGAAWHDWAALELGAWVARATDVPLRLIGAASEARADRRDASRLLADASLIVQRQAGVVVEPLLGSPGREGVLALARGGRAAGCGTVGPLGGGGPRAGATADALWLVADAGRSLSRRDALPRRYRPAPWAVTGVREGELIPDGRTGRPPALEGEQMSRSRLLVTTTALVAACALPASAAAQQDLRSPDTRDAADGVGLYAESSTSQDLRSPDAKDAAAHAGLYAKEEPRAHVYQDLRSPDARDAALGLPRAPVTTVTLAEPASGFDWGDAGIGAAGMLALVFIAVGGMLIVGTRRRRRIGVAVS